MTDRPILFSAPMVRAILAGTKTQTRRVVKLPHENSLGVWEPTRFGGPQGGRTAAGETIPEQGGIWHTRTGDHLGCPYGQPGDRLWVRETWAHGRHAAAANCVEDGPFVYAADGEFAARERLNPRWVPGIHMFRWASRITLEITRVRLERLNAITEADCVAEGIEKTAHDFWRLYGPHYGANATYSPRTSFRTLWGSINGAESWAADPWVWVVEFKRLDHSDAAATRRAA